MNLAEVSWNIQWKWLWGLDPNYDIAQDTEDGTNSIYDIVVPKPASVLVTLSHQISAMCPCLIMHPHWGPKGRGVADRQRRGLGRLLYGPACILNYCKNGYYIYYVYYGYYGKYGYYGYYGYYDF